MAKGVFGSPFVIVDGEPFWGFDRFEQVEAHLKARRQTELRAVPGVASLDNKEKTSA
ncbi:hypothetical protein D9M72_657430 [compost metagenome]